MLPGAKPKWLFYEAELEADSSSTEIKEHSNILDEDGKLLHGLYLTGELGIKKIKKR